MPPQSLTSDTSIIGGMLTGVLLDSILVLLSSLGYRTTETIWRFAPSFSVDRDCDRADLYLLSQVCNVSWAPLFHFYTRTIRQVGWNRDATVVKLCVGACAAPILVAGILNSYSYISTVLEFGG